MYTAAQLEGGRLHWLLDITIAGRVFRFADDYLEVTSADGTVYAYEGQLPADLTIEREVAGVGQLPSLQSASFEVFLPVDIAEVVARGHSIAAGRGELSLWLEGEDYETRGVTLTGLLDDSPTYGEDGEAFAFSLTEEPYDDTALTHSPTERVSRDTWPNAASEALGEWYPIVYGRPGYVVDNSGGLTYRPGSPAPLVVGSSTADKVLLAGHRTVAGATGATVSLYQANDQLFYDATATHETDGLGRTVTTASITGASSNFRSTTASYWCAWKGTGAYRRARAKSEVMTAAGEVMSWLLDMSSLDVSRGRFRAIEPQTVGMQVAGYIDEPVSPWRYVRDHLLPLLPLGLVSRGGSLIPIMLDIAMPRRFTFTKLVEGREVVRTSMATVDAGNHFNELLFRYALNADSNVYQRQVIITPQRDSDDADQTTGPYPRASFARFGLRPVDMTTDVVYDNASAKRIAHTLMRLHWTPPLVVEYTGGAELSFLSEGDFVLVTDAGLHLDERVGMVARISKGLSVVGMELRFWEVMGRDPIEV